VIPRVVGLDMSMTGTGIACYVGFETWDLHTIQSSGHLTDSLYRRADRLTFLQHSILAHILDPARADLVVVEAPAFASKSGHMHDRSGLWWLVIHSCRSLGIPVAEVAPKGRAKYGTGLGNASKDTVLAAAVRRYADAPIRNNNEADAVILAAMGLRHLGTPVETSLPVVHQVAMNAVRWPE
jgi:crossover junction endodeoxyribonuclease RuvC